MNWLLATGIPVVLAFTGGWLAAHQRYLNRVPNIDLDIYVPEGTTDEAIEHILREIAAHDKQRGLTL